jgi:hypothetical protein
LSRKCRVAEDWVDAVSVGVPRLARTKIVAYAVASSACVSPARTAFLDTTLFAVSDSVNKEELTFEDTVAEVPFA